MQLNPITFSVKQLAFERSYQFLFNDLSFELHSGELLQICGDNGTGKSTLLRILAGFIEPHDGQVVWAGKPITNDLPHYQSHIHYLGHQNGIKQNLTIHENLMLYFALANKTAHWPSLDNLIDQIGLGHLLHTKALNLSAGQLRRLALLRLLANPTSLWIMDEPTTALDTTGQQLLIHFLKQHLANNGMAIVATHHHLPFDDLKTIQLGVINDE
jgi:heme exporter protein A